MARRSSLVLTAAAPSGTHGLQPNWMENTPSRPWASARRAASAVSAAVREAGNIIQ